MTRIDVNTFVGSYPYRNIGATGADLLRDLQRWQIDAAWVSHLAAVFWRDPAAGNQDLFALQRAHPSLRAIPAVHPGMPGWIGVIANASLDRCPAVRCDPAHYGLAPAGRELREMSAACADSALPLMMAVRFEDVRQRHPNDHAPDLTPADVRFLVRQTPALRLVITHADREFVEQVHFGLTPGEAQRILWDLSCIWGPPEDHLALLLETVGAARFTFGSGMPLRIGEAAVARVDLLDPSDDLRDQLYGGNLARFLEGTA